MRSKMPTIMIKGVQIATGAFLVLCLAWSGARAGGLELSSQNVAFGDMREGIVARKAVVVSNTGTGKLTIANVTTN